MPYGGHKNVKDSTNRNLYCLILAQVLARDIFMPKSDMFMSKSIWLTDQIQVDVESTDQCTCSI